MRTGAPPATRNAPAAPLTPRPAAPRPPTEPRRRRHAAPPPCATGQDGEGGLGHRLTALSLAVLATLGGGGGGGAAFAAGAPDATPPPPPALSPLITLSASEYEAAAAARAAARRGGGGAGAGAGAVTTTVPASAHRRRSAHGLPDAASASALASFDRDAFTDDGWAAAQTIAAYARYVDSIAADEAAPGCEACEGHRAALERVWQTVSREYYPPPAAAPFTQAAWAARLLPALRSAPGGLLRTQRDFEAAAAAMVATLGDRYTAYLPAPAFRAALRRPTAGELPYLAARVGSGPGIVLASDGDGAGGRGSSSPPPTAPGSAASPSPGVPIVAVAAESAAEAAGVRPGDTLLEADWYRVDRLTPADARALLRGPAGSDLTLTILPGGGGGGSGRPADAAAGRHAAAFMSSTPSPPRRRPVTLSVERRSIPQPPTKVSWVLTTPGPRALPLGYVRVHYFAREATDALAGALLAGEARGVAGWVVDLRGNPGGVFEEGVASASLLLPRGAAVARTVRAGSAPGGGATFVAGATLPAADFPATAAGALTNLPVAVVVDAGSASAAEVFASAVTGGARRGGGGGGGAAALVGAGRTFGKGLVQYYFPTDGGGGGGGGSGRGGRGSSSSSSSSSLGGLKVTVARYLSPAPSRPGGWADVQGEHGLAPSVACAAVAPSLLGAAVPHGPRDVGHPGPGEPDPATDGCLASALRWLEREAV